MPAPRENQIPDYEYWGFVQKDCKSAELISLAENIVANDGATLDDNVKENILSFLATADKVSAWSDYWITIINTLGLAYINPKTSRVEKTKLSDYLAEKKEIKGFYYYWALKFQFPFAQSKHKGYKDQGIVIQPVILMLEYLVELFEQSLRDNRDSIENAYITYEEIVLVLSKSRSNSILKIKENVKDILVNREDDYHYDNLKINGYESIYRNFTGRARLYFEKFDLLLFDQREEKIYIRDWEHYYKIIAFLSFRKRPHKLTNEDSRIGFFQNVFNELDPYPLSLYNSINNVVIKRS